MTPFSLEFPIRFADCDPAGIVYFPRFLEMVNHLTESWFGEALDMPFRKFHLELKLGVPVVNTRVEFLKACQIGERIRWELGVETIGRSSVVLRISGRVGDEERLRLRHKVAMIGGELIRAIAIPDELRGKMQAFRIPGADKTADPVSHDGNVPANAFVSRQLVRFSHCDPAGIVFYPRFFDMLNAAQEDWFAQGLACPWGGDYMGPRNLRLPSLNITVEFIRACRLSETIDFHLWVTRLGRSTLELAIEGRVAGETRLRATLTDCVIDFTRFKSTPIPDDLRTRMQAFLSA